MKLELLSPEDATRPFRRNADGSYSRKRCKEEIPSVGQPDRLPDLLQPSPALLRGRAAFSEGEKK